MQLEGVSVDFVDGNQNVILKKTLIITLITFHNFSLVQFNCLQSSTYLVIDCDQF